MLDSYWNDAFEKKSSAAISPSGLQKNMFLWSCPSTVIKTSKSMSSPIITNSFDFKMAVVTIRMSASFSACYIWMSHCLNSFLSNDINWCYFWRTSFLQLQIVKFLLLMFVQAFFKNRNFSELFTQIFTGSDGYPLKITAIRFPQCYLR